MILDYPGELSIVTRVLPSKREAEGELALGEKDRYVTREGDALEDTGRMLSGQPPETGKGQETDRPLEPQEEPALSTS